MKDDYDLMMWFILMVSMWIIVAGLVLLLASFPQWACPTMKAYNCTLFEIP